MTKEPTQVSCRLKNPCTTCYRLCVISPLRLKKILFVFPFVSLIVTTISLLEQFKKKTVGRRSLRTLIWNRSFIFLLVKPTNVSIYLNTPTE